MNNREHNFIVDDVFFLWDKYFDDDREGISSGTTYYNEKRATQISFEKVEDPKAGIEFYNELIKMLDNSNIDYKIDGQELFLIDELKK